MHDLGSWLLDEAWPFHFVSDDLEEKNLSSIFFFVGLRHVE